MEEDAVLAFKQLYEEIDKLYYQQSSAPTLEKGKREGSDSKQSDFVLKDEDVDELIEYSKKFVEKTKNEIHISGTKQLHEHGVQCTRSEKKCNKKLNTPPKWIQSKDKETIGTNCATAIRIIKRIPKTQFKETTVVSYKSPEGKQLNNQRPPKELKKLRNVGVNVNFINRKAIKQPNNTTQTLESLTESHTPPIIKKQVTPQPSGKIYRFYSSKLSPAQLWQQQHPELSYESSERSIFPRRTKKSNIDVKQEKPTAVNELNKTKELKIVHFTEGLENCTINEDRDVPKTTEKNEDVPKTETTAAKPVITKHVIPTISIKGDWKSGLQIQEACRINIRDEKRDDKQQLNPSNLMYLEVKHGSMPEPSNIQGNTEDQQEKVASQSIPTATQTADLGKEFEENLIPTKCTLDSLKLNRYLQPFLDARKSRTTANQLIFGVSSDSSSNDSMEGIVLQSDSSDSDFDDPVQNFLDLHSTAKPNINTKTPKKINFEDNSKDQSPILPKLPSPKKSVQLQVPSPPCRLTSPPRTPPKSDAEDEMASILPCSDGPSSSKFLENLRIWKSAIEVQSESMKLGNQLSENLDILKQNMAKIAGETQNISQITRSCERNLREIEGLKERCAEKWDGSGSVVASSRHLNKFTQPIHTEALTGCSCFGCHPQLDIFETEPNFDQKTFQRAVLEQSPRYSKTIRKICEDGRKRSYKKVLSPSRGVAEQAVRKFLQSCSSRSVSRISQRDTFPRSETSIRSHSPSSVGSYSVESYCSGVVSSSCSSDVETASVTGGITRRGVEYSESGSNGSGQEGRVKRIYNSTSISDKSSDDFTRIRQSLSDEGEVLSQGEVK